MSHSQRGSGNSLQHQLLKRNSRHSVYREPSNSVLWKPLRPQDEHIKPHCRHCSAPCLSVCQVDCLSASLLLCGQHKDHRGLYNYCVYLSKSRMNFIPVETAMEVIFHSDIDLRGSCSDLWGPTLIIFQCVKSIAGGFTHAAVIAWSMLLQKLTIFFYSAALSVIFQSTRCHRGRFHGSRWLRFSVHSSAYQRSVRSPQLKIQQQLFVFLLVWWFLFFERQFKHISLIVLLNDFNTLQYKCNYFFDRQFHILLWIIV